MVISTKNPETGRHELVLVAPEGFDVATAQRSLAAAMAPPAKPQLAKWLATLSAITISRPRDELDAGLIMAIYSERLAAYPADVVEHVLLRERWKFFPAIAELEEACDALSSRRRAIASLLAQGRVRCGEPHHQPDRGPRMSPEARQRIMAEVWPEAAEQDARGPWRSAVAQTCEAAGRIPEQETT
ncbi:hypothetical protein [Lacimonas salitolerans]|uniref:Uncharacterized protein n=1 Tax=Lacimonas salitolerans TaxID=1323750 RepID=A0ABW4EMX0_9RHOB